MANRCSFKTGKDVVVIAANNNNSPYAEVTQNRIAALRPRFEAGLDPIEVAKVILKAATSEKKRKDADDIRHCYMVKYYAYAKIVSE